MSIKTEDYNAGFEDGLSYANQNSISQDALMESFDKFLDVINEHKKVLRHVKNHFEGVSVEGFTMQGKKDTDHNVFMLQNLIEIILKQSGTKEKVNVETQRK